MSFPLYKEKDNFNGHWLNGIPSHWNTKRLKYVSDVKPSNVDKKINEDEIPVKLCNYVDVFKNDFIDNSFEFMEASATKEEIEKFSICDDDVIITKDSETPKEIAIPAYVKEDLHNTICGYHLAHIKTSKDVLLGSYLFRLFQSKNLGSYFETLANGITRFGLGVDSIKDAIVFLPSIQEQKSITAFLDYKTEQIDNLIEKKELLLKLLDEKRIALITQSVTKGINPDVKMKPSGVDWIGNIPEHWANKRLRFLTSNGLSNGLFKKKEDWGDGLKIVNVSDIYVNSFIIDIDKLDRVNCNEKEYLTYQVKNGDFFFVRSSLKLEGIGQSASYFKENNDEERAVFECHLVKGSPISSIIDPRFLNYFLNSSLAKNIFIRVSNTVTMTTIDQNKLKDIYIYYPAIDEQKEIVSYLDKEINSLDGLFHEIKNNIGYLEEYKMSLITSAVTGKIDVRNFKPGK